MHPPAVCYPFASKYNHPVADIRAGSLVLRSHSQATVKRQFKLTTTESGLQYPNTFARLALS